MNRSLCVNVRLVVHIDDRLPILFNSFLAVIACILIAGNLLGIVGVNSFCLFTSDTAFIFIGGNFISIIIPIADFIVDCNLCCAYLNIQMPRKSTIRIYISFGHTILKFIALNCLTRHRNRQIRRISAASIQLRNYSIISGQTLNARAAILFIAFVINAIC